MATLDPSNVINGNTIEASDIAQLYQAFGTGSGADITGLSMTGSLYGNALTATTATTATTAATSSKSTIPSPTNTGTYYLTFVEGTGTYAPKIDSNLEYNAATNNLVVTASYATNVQNVSATQVDSQQYTIVSAGPVEANFRFVAGVIKCTSGVGQTPNNPLLIGKTLGADAWITLTLAVGSLAPGQVTAVKALNTSTGVIDIVTAGGSGAEDVHYHVIYIPS